MTEQDIDAIVGRTRREYREAKQHLSAIEAEADKLAEFVKGLAGSLGAPASLVFEGQQYAERYQPLGHKTPFRDSDFANLNPPYLRSLGEQVRAQMEKIKQLRNCLIELEGEDPETRRTKLYDDAIR